jgi:TPR repeat protein
MSVEFKLGNIKTLGQKMQIKKVIVGLTLSLLLGSGITVAADYEKGFQAFQKGVYEVALAEWVPLAEQGDIDSQNTLAAIFKLGLGVKKNPEKAVKWYRLAAEQGDAAGQYGLGTMYAAGEGVPQDYNVALKWFNLAAAQGDVAAQFNLGLMYDNGIAKDMDRAYVWYNISAYGGNELGAKNKQLLASDMDTSQKTKLQSLSNTCLASGYTDC